MSPGIRSLAAVFVALLGGDFLFAQDDEDDPYAPGLAVTFRDEAGHTAVRFEPSLSFVATDQAPDPRLHAGPFRSVWKGLLRVTAAGEHRFHLHGNGDVEIKVAGKVVIPKTPLKNTWHDSAPIALPADYLPFEMSFDGNSADARVMVCWSGPRFRVEPVPSRFLFHEREKSPKRDFERGRILAMSLRCGRCHVGEETTSPAPALDRLSGNLSRDWLEHWLVEPHAPAAETPTRRMPTFGLTAAQARDIADYLLAARPRTERNPSEKKPEAPMPKSKAKSKPDAATGEKLFVSLGCLACHSWKGLGTRNAFDGGDLTTIADKRPAAFFANWLAEPESFNRDHRMPTFALSADERTSLSLFLTAQMSPNLKPKFDSDGSPESRARGEKWVKQFQCASCHQLPGAAEKTTPSASKLTAKSRWDEGCSGNFDASKSRPGYRLAKPEALALQVYFSERVSIAPLKQPDARTLLLESNCLACHSREGRGPMAPPAMADRLVAVGKRYPDLAAQLGALMPPTLTSVGDKLNDAALKEAIGRSGDHRRPYLQVRMPRFPLKEAELHAIANHFIAMDRMPPRETRPALDATKAERFRVAGSRLVSGDGFGCTSCHQVGSAPPPPGPASSRGPDLSGLERRIRREWFDRWLHDPARIVPRMEMPAVQIPVSGVLDAKLEDQIAAVWHVLNIPGFEPPPPDPVRILRQHGQDPHAEAVVVTDVLRVGGRMLLKPFLIGLANRHNVLLDLDSGSLALWTVGDTARQQTKGKAWYWDAGGTSVLETGIAAPDISLVQGSETIRAKLRGQFVTEADAWQSSGTSLDLEYRLTFKDDTVRVRRKFTPLADGFTQELTIGSVPAGLSVKLEVLAAAGAEKATRSADGRGLVLDGFARRIIIREPAGSTFNAARTAILLPANREVRLVLEYRSTIPVDQLPLPPPAVEGLKPASVEIGPGFTGTRLPLPPAIMPTGLGWRPDGRLVFSSLKGQVYEAADRDGDGNEDTVTILADGLPAPYGVNAGPGYVDVSAKFGVLRVPDLKSGRRVELLASGWGYSFDYHDWTLGLPRGERGEYYVGIACQQDKRGPDAAMFKSSVLKLVPRAPTNDDPRRFAIEPLSAGSRFPMGLALSKSGDLFVTDNQGNYKPFNELNHVRPGVHFGFINSLDRDKPAPPRTFASVEIPHPWTRSVNGICFLGGKSFGPFDGHLVGCEYNGRMLVRLTLEKVGDTYQGAVYPMSVPPSDPARGFVGPLVCAVSPKGELYVGGVWDSGWGAGNNVGEIVRVQMKPDALPCGIAEVKAKADGFTIDFLKPLDRDAAGRIENYTIESYRREATPAYGGTDKDRRVEKVRAIAVSPDGRRATLTLPEMRPGFVYEMRLKNLVPAGETFFPAEAHYTLRVVPR